MNPISSGRPFAGSDARFRCVATISCDELIRSRPAFAYLNRACLLLKRGEAPNRVIVAVAGQTGYGKSSLLNALVGRDAFEPSEVESGTKELQSLDVILRTGDGHRLSFIDTPGFGESAEADEVYRPMYEQSLRSCAAILYLFRADRRDLACDQAFFARFLTGLAQRRVVIPVLSAVDKTEPMEAEAPVALSEQQARHVRARVHQIARVLGVSDAIPSSVPLGVGFDAIADALRSLLVWPHGPLI